MSTTTNMETFTIPKGRKSLTPDLLLAFLAMPEKIVPPKRHALRLAELKRTENKRYKAGLVAEHGNQIQIVRENIADHMEAQGCGKVRLVLHGTEFTVWAVQAIVGPLIKRVTGIKVPA